MDWDRIGPAVDVRALFPVERELLLGMLSALPTGAWNLPTCCTGWSVHDVVAHLVHDYVRRLSGYRDGHPGVSFLEGESLPGYLTRVNGDFVHVSRALSPRILIDLLATFGPQLDELWAACDLTALGHMAVWWVDPVEPAPLWLDVGREYTEFWVHQQHVRTAVGLPGAGDTALMAPVIDIFLRALPYVLRDTPAADGAGLAVDVGQPVGGVWVARKDTQGWALTRCDAGEDPGRVDAQITTSPDTLWQLATGLITAHTARAMVLTTGDEPLIEAALQIVSIIR